MSRRARCRCVLHHQCVTTRGVTAGNFLSAAHVTVVPSTPRWIPLAVRDGLGTVHLTAVVWTSLASAGPVAVRRVFALTPLTTIALSMVLLCTLRASSVGCNSPPPSPCSATPRLRPSTVCQSKVSITCSGGVGAHAGVTFTVACQWLLRDWNPVPAESLRPGAVSNALSLPCLCVCVWSRNDLAERASSRFGAWLETAPDEAVDCVMRPDKPAVARWVLSS